MNGPMNGPTLVSAGPTEEARQKRIQEAMQREGMIANFSSELIKSAMTGIGAFEMSQGTAKDFVYSVRMIAREFFDQTDRSLAEVQDAAPVLMMPNSSGLRN